MRKRKFIYPKNHFKNFELMSDEELMETYNHLKKYKGPTQRSLYAFLRVSNIIMERKLIK